MFGICRTEMLASAVSRIQTDGLNHTSYQVMSRQEYGLYTKIMVDLNGEVDCNE